MLKRIVLAGFLLMLSVSIAAAENPGKIGVVDFKTLIDSSETGSSAKSELKEKGEAIKAELEQYKAELQQMQETYQRESTLWTEEQRREKQKFFQAEVNELRRLQQQKTKEFNEFRADLFNELKEDLIADLEKKGKEEGYALIFEQRTGEVLYADPSMDITQEIVELYNKKKKQ
jgi:outer membrane protein